MDSLPPLEGLYTIGRRALGALGTSDAGCRLLVTEWAATGKLHLIGPNGAVCGGIGTRAMAVSLTEVRVHN